MMQLQVYPCNDYTLSVYLSELLPLLKVFLVFGCTWFVLDIIDTMRSWLRK